MKIINRTKNSILTETAIVANTPFKRMQGLLGRKELKEGEALILNPCNSIHTFFMRFPIDVIFVDSNHTVVKLIPNLKPWRASGIYFLAKYCIELPSGAIVARQTSIGDTLSFSGTPFNPIGGLSPTQSRDTL